MRFRRSGLRFRSAIFVATTPFQSSSLFFKSFVFATKMRFRSSSFGDRAFGGRDLGGRDFWWQIFWWQRFCPARMRGGLKNVCREIGIVRESVRAYVVRAYPKSLPCFDNFSFAKSRPQMRPSQIFQGSGLDRSFSM